MLVSPKHLRTWFNVLPVGVLHVGAHQAEELDAYRNEGFGRVLWVEGQAALISYLESKVQSSQDKVFHAIAWSESGIALDFNISNNGQSSSLYEFGRHLDYHPEVRFVDKLKVKTVRLDELIPIDDFFDFVNLDIQGAELDALRGLSNRLTDVRWIYSEVNREKLYQGIPLVGALDSFLRDFGFFRVVTIWTFANWGDALYVKKSHFLNSIWLRFKGLVFEGCQAVAGFLHRFAKLLVRGWDAIFRLFIRPLRHLKNPQR